LSYERGALKSRYTNPVYASGMAILKQCSNPRCRQAKITQQGAPQIKGDGLVFSCHICGAAIVEVPEFREPEPDDPLREP